MKTICLFILIWILPLAAMAQETPLFFTVDQAVKDAILRNPSIKEAAEYISGAREAVKSSRADLFAKASLNYSYTGLDQQPIMKTVQQETFTAHANQYAWDLTLAQPLFTGFALSTTLDIAKLGVKDQKIQREMAILDLARDVKVTCYNFLLTQKMLLVAESEATSLKAHREVAREFYNQELIPKNDLLRSEVALADSIQTLEKTRASVDYARSLLNTLLDYDVNRPVSVADVETVPGSNYELVRLAQHAIDKRPLIRGLKNTLDQTRLSEKLAKSSLYPKVSLVGQYGQNGDDLSAANNDYTNSQNASISLQVGWTFFEWGKTRADVKQTLHKGKAVQEKIRGTENTVRLEVKNALLNLEVAEKNIKTAQKSLGQARENFRITNVQYAQQVVTSNIVLDARSFLTNADTNYYQALYGYMAYLADLARALGDL